MNNPKLQKLANIGQSIWCDSFSRKLLNSGKIEELVEQGVKGMTSNPKMFHQATLYVKLEGSSSSPLKGLNGDGKTQG